jgi:kinesin family protein 2/24
VQHGARNEGDNGAEGSEASPPVGALADEDPVTRQMIDKRQSRKMNRRAFGVAITEWRDAHPATKVLPGAAQGERAPLASLGGTTQQQAVDAVGGGSGARRLRAIVRKRPLFAYEFERGEFDVVSVRAPSSVHVHNCCMQPDLKRMFVKHMSFSVGDAFDETMETSDVCERGVHPLLSNVLSGGCSTLFMYGQTGSGKTHTMCGIEDYAASLLLPPKPMVAVPSPGGDEVEPDASEPPMGHLSFFEIAGSRCIELLGDQHGRELALRQVSADGRVEPMGATRVPLYCAADLLRLISVAKSRRATESTGANAASSRSHAVCQLTLAPRAIVAATAAATAAPTAAPPRPHGGRNRRGSVIRPAILTLVDCAGTERKEDSMWHDAERRKEGAEINQSLHALKECMRHWVNVQDGKAGHIPFRESALTRVLADSFLRADTLITVVGTVSPSASDTEHTITTLKTVSAVCGTDQQLREKKCDVKPIVEAPAAHTIPPKMWNEERVREWLGSAVSARGEPLAAVLPLVPDGITGKLIMRMTALQFRQLWGAPEDLSNALFHELRVATRNAEAAKDSKRRGARAAEQRRKAGQL